MQKQLEVNYGCELLLEDINYKRNVTECVILTRYFSPNTAASKHSRFSSRSQFLIDSLGLIQTTPQRNSYKYLFPSVLRELTDSTKKSTFRLAFSKINFAMIISLFETINWPKKKRYKNLVSVAL